MASESGGQNPPIARRDRAESSAGHVKANSIFHRSIPSNFTEDAVFHLLLYLCEYHGEAGWSHFTKEDIKLLSQGFSVLDFPSGTRLMKKGEPSTFVAILLKGSAQVNVNASIQVEIGTGMYLSPVICSVLFYSVYLLVCFPLLISLTSSCLSPVLLNMCCIHFSEIISRLFHI